MEIGRFLIRLEKKRLVERVFKKRKGRKFRFGKRKEFEFQSLKGLVKREVERKKTYLYTYPLVESIGYTYDKTKYYLKTGLKKNLVLSDDMISVYKTDGKDWLNLRFNYQKKNIGYLFRNKWYVGARRYRKNLNKRKRYEEWIYSMHYRLKKKEKDLPLMKILRKGIPVQIGKYHSRIPLVKEVDYSNVIYFLKERFLMYSNSRGEMISHEIEFEKKREKRKKRRRRFKRRKGGLVLWNHPLRLVVFKKEGWIERKNAPIRSVYISESV